MLFLAISVKARLVKVAVVGKSHFQVLVSQRLKWATHSRAVFVLYGYLTNNIKVVCLYIHFYVVIMELLNAMEILQQHL